MRKQLREPYDPCAVRPTSSSESRLRSADLAAEHGSNRPTQLQGHLDKMRVAFDECADGWDAIHGPGSPNGHGFESRLRYLRSTCIGRVCPRVLDVGCASGLYLFGVTDLVSEGVGIDISPRMIDRARELAVRRHRERTLQFTVAAVEEITPAAFGRFDLVFIVGTLEHLQDPRSALTVMHQMLAPAGEIVVIMRHPWYSNTLSRRLTGKSREIPRHRHLSPRHLCGLARCAGLEPVSLCPLDRPSPWILLLWRGLALPPTVRPLWSSLTYAAHLASPNSRGMRAS